MGFGPLQAQMVPHPQEAAALRTEISRLQATAVAERNAAADEPPP